MRKLLYHLGRLLGDVNAVRRGPVAIGKRLVRKSLIKRTYRIINKITR